MYGNGNRKDYTDSELLGSFCYDMQDEKDEKDGIAFSGIPFDRERFEASRTTKILRFLSDSSGTAASINGSKPKHMSSSESPIISTARLSQ